MQHLGLVSDRQVIAFSSKSEVTVSCSGNITLYVFFRVFFVIFIVPRQKFFASDGENDVIAFTAWGFLVVGVLEQVKDFLGKRVAVKPLIVYVNIYASQHIAVPQLRKHYSHAVTIMLLDSLVCLLVGTPCCWGVGFCPLPCVSVDWHFRRFAVTFHTPPEYPHFPFFEFVHTQGELLCFTLQIIAIESNFGHFAHKNNLSFHAWQRGSCSRLLIITRFRLFWQIGEKHT